MLTLARAKQVAVLLEQGAAAGAVHHDEVGAMPEGPQVLPRERFGTLAVTRVLMQRPATALPVDLHDTIAVGFEHAPGRVIDVTEDGIHDAAAKEGYRGRGMGYVKVGEQARLLMAPGRRQHPHAEPEARSAGQAGGKPGGAKPARGGEQRSPDQPARRTP